MNQNNILSVSTDYVESILAILEPCVFSEIKKDSDDFEKINVLCSFYQSVKNAAASEENKKSVILPVREEYEAYIPNVEKFRIGKRH